MPFFLIVAVPRLRRHDFRSASPFMSNSGHPVLTFTCDWQASDQAHEASASSPPAVDKGRGATMVMGAHRRARSLGAGHPEPSPAPCEGEAFALRLLLGRKPCRVQLAQPPGCCGSTPRRRPLSLYPRIWLLE